jgi:hypothetical protein
MHSTLKAFFHTALVLLLMLISTWLVIDIFFGQKILNTLSQKQSVMKQLNQGWYELKSKYIGEERFGTTSFQEITNKDGFRVEVIDNRRKKALFLGDSFIHGVGVNYPRTIPGIFESISGIESLNGGVPSYSPTAYLYQYKKALAANSLKDEHLVIVGIDISDVQDEAAIWKDGSQHPIKRSNNKSGTDYTIQSVNKDKLSNPHRNFLNILIREFPLSYRIYSILRQSLFSQVDTQNVEKNSETKSIPPEDVLDLARSAHTWLDWSFLNTQSLDAYTPLGVEGGLSRIELKMQRLVQMVHRREGQVFLFTYPWPAQIAYRSKEKFSFNEWVKQMCSRVNCDGYVPVYEGVIEYAIANPNWYSNLYIYGDVHFKDSGNNLVAETLNDGISRLQLRNN